MILYGKTVFNLIARDWGYMLYNRATSFWETIKGADDFEMEPESWLLGYIPEK
jgi:hypothetical protein